MKLIRGLNNIPRDLNACVVSIGSFDGLHIGHQQLIHALKQSAKALNLPSVMITFEPLPLEYFYQGEKVPRLMRLAEKYLMLQKFGVDYLLCLRFKKKLATLSAQDFVHALLVDKLHVKSCVVGDDFHFGAKRAGDFELLASLGKQFGFSAQQVDTVLFHDERVSSTRVREALKLGNLDLVTQLLDRPYSLYGKVVRGDQRGRELGFPTANINLHRQLVPLSGVFVIRTKPIAGQVYNGVANVGIRPTFDGTRVLLEVHLFDFDGDLYGQNIEVLFLHKLRDEQRYDSFAALVSQIRQDVLEAKMYCQEKKEGKGS